MTTLATQPPLYVSFDELLPRYGETRSRTQLRRDMTSGKFPAATQVSLGRIGWRTAELDKHYNSRPKIVYKKKKRAA